MKRLSIRLTALFAVTLAISAQEDRVLALERTADSAQVSTTVAEEEGGKTAALMFTLQHVQGVTPAFQLLVVLETANPVDFKEGNGVVLLLDSERVPLKGICQHPMPHPGGVTQVGLCFLSSAEVDRICAAKNLRVSFEGGKAGGHVVFRIPRPDFQFKAFHNYANSKK